MHSTLELEDSLKVLFGIVSQKFGLIPLCRKSLRASIGVPGPTCEVLAVCVEDLRASALMEKGCYAKPCNPILATWSKDWRKKPVQTSTTPASFLYLPTRGFI
jgi:hypothetical protein